VVPSIISCFFETKSWFHRPSIPSTSGLERFDLDQCAHCSREPAFMPLRLDKGRAGFTLGIEGVEGLHPHQSTFGCKSRNEPS
jgi:hypothetical protein